MIRKYILRFFILALICQVSVNISGQNVPFGINYQAVARDNFGKELINKEISVRFSVISGNPLGPVVYQELHSKVTTSKYGVFSLIIGKGTPTGGTYSDLSQVQWSTANHFLKVDVKFENDFIDMGTMQFLSVPYALYAQKSLEPGPAGPKGDPGPKGEQGDPASDKQTLSFNGANLSISNGNTVNLSSLDKPHQLTLLGDTLSILGGNKVGLTNQIQDLTLDVNNKLKITKNAAATAIDLSRYLQTLSFNTTDHKLTISGSSSTVEISDADSDPTNELQNLSYVQSSNTLTISKGNSVIISNTIGFKAKRSISMTGLNINMTYPFINAEAEFIESSCYNTGSGNFTAPSAGIYTFYITYKADGSGSSRAMNLLKNGAIYEVLNGDISSGTELFKWVIMKLNTGDVISLTIFTGNATVSGTGSFLGYRVN